jgi:hypothetical protein
MSKRRPQRNTANRAKQKPKFKLETFSVSKEDHPKLKAAMHEVALIAVADFPKILELVKDQLRRHDPIGIMACFAGYELITIVGSEDGSKRKASKDIPQHHAELLQAIVLTITPDQWGQAPVVPGVMQIVSDSLPKLSDTFFHQRMLEAEKVSEQELAVLSLQERIRMHTMGVRNWGHFGAVIRISKELYSAIDAAFASHYGFSCTDFIEVMQCAVSELDRRQTEHWNRFRNVMRGKNAQQVFRLYFKNVPGLVGNAEGMLAALPGIDVNAAKATVMAHYSLRLSDCGTFTPDEIAKLTGRSSQIVESVFRAISLTPGGLAEVKTEHLFLGNPIWEAPAIDLGDSFFLPMPQAVLLRDNLNEKERQSG